jgi:hypothetical protein
MQTRESRRADVPDSVPLASTPLMPPYSFSVLLLVLLPAVIVGCARPDYAESWPDQLFLSAGAQPGYGIKQIIEKQSPATLVAEDGSVCRTSRERFNRAREGHWIACIWNLPILDSAPPVEPEDRSDGGTVATGD